MLEKYTEVISSKEQTRPWVKAAEISDEIIKELDDFKPDLMVINYANGDMVRHTGHIYVARLAMECVDLCLARVFPEVVRCNGVLLVPTDHGNSEIMADLGKDGKPKNGSQPDGWKAMVSNNHHSP